MKAWLFDTNLLIALLWPTHEFHDAAQRWFRSNQRAGWATCPITEAGFVRIISNPAFSRDAVSPAEASEHLSISFAAGKHRFVTASISLGKAIAPFAARITGHQQITDAYLLGLALHHGLRLATFDRTIASLAEAHSGLFGLIDS